MSRVKSKTKLGIPEAEIKDSRIVKSLFHYKRALVSVLISALSFLIPRTNSIWVVGGSKGLKFGDNSMHFFKFCSLNTDKCIVWLTRSDSVLAEVASEGLIAYPIKSLRGLWFGLRAKWHIFDVTPNDCGPTSKTAKLLNLWHGIPLKDTRFLKSKKELAGSAFPVPRVFCRVESDDMYFVHPDKKHIQHILDSFDVLEPNVIYANLPRNANLHDKNASRLVAKQTDLPAIERIETSASENFKIIGYFPTWRGNGSDSFLGTLDSSEIESFNDFLFDSKCLLVTKWHDCVYSAYEHSGANAKAENLLDLLRRQSQFLVLDFDADLNSHLAFCDLLITDYSSVFFDFLLLNRPMLFFADDLEEYRSRWGFFYDYETFVPGPISRNIQHLIENLSSWRLNTVSFDREFEERRLNYASIFFENPGDVGFIVAEMNARS